MPVHHWPGSRAVDTPPSRPRHSSSHHTLSPTDLGRGSLRDLRSPSTHLRDERQLAPSLTLQTGECNFSIFLVYYIEYFSKLFGHLSIPLPVTSKLLVISYLCIAHQTRSRWCSTTMAGRGSTGSRYSWQTDSPTHCSLCRTW